jgi:biopolymer transport protein ExbB
MYRKSKTDMTLLASHLSKPLHEGKLFEAEKIAANAGGLTGDLILKAIAHERHIDDMASWLEMEGQHRAASLKTNLGHRDARASYGAPRNGAWHDPVV